MYLVPLTASANASRELLRRRTVGRQSLEVPVPCAYCFPDEDEGGLGLPGHRAPGSAAVYYRFAFGTNKPLAALRGGQRRMNDSGRSSQVVSHLRR